MPLFTLVFMSTLGSSHRTGAYTFSLPIGVASSAPLCKDHEQTDSLLVSGEKTVLLGKGDYFAIDLHIGPFMLIHEGFSQLAAD